MPRPSTKHTAAVQRRRIGATGMEAHDGLRNGGLVRAMKGGIVSIETSVCTLLDQVCWLDELVLVGVVEVSTNDRTGR
jgi:hypothetical protein